MHDRPDYANVGQLRELLATIPDHVRLLAIVLNVPTSGQPGERTDAAALVHQVAYDAVSGTLDLRGRK
jgi:hypothetical protein